MTGTQCHDNEVGTGWNKVGTGWNTLKNQAFFLLFQPILTF
jgi:hypothetical protein